jgi:hypothetical protein
MFLDHARKILKKHKKDLVQLGVRTLSLFGSVSRNQETKKSDVDVLIDFDARKGLFVFVQIQQFLEQLLGRKVDLVTKNALHPALKKQILKEAKNVF